MLRGFFSGIAQSVREFVGNIREGAANIAHSAESFFRGGDRPIPTETFAPSLRQEPLQESVPPEIAASEPPLAQLAREEWSEFYERTTTPVFDSEGFEITPEVEYLSRIPDGATLRQEFWSQADAVDYVIQTRGGLGLAIFSIVYDQYADTYQVYLTYSKE